MARILPTLKKLNELLTAAGYTGPEVRKEACETYGSQTRAYFFTGTIGNRRVIEHALARAGVRVFTDYNPGQPTVEVQVSYLRAYGWRG